MNTKITKNIWKTPQFSVAIFVIISAFTTGQGMTETFFDGNLLCGIAISIGIQLLLVWLGYTLPKLFSLGDKTARIFLIITCTFTISWSTGFSFMYVCNHVYSSVYMRDDQSLLAETYRESISDMKQYADKAFNTHLKEITNNINKLQKRAISIDTSSDNNTAIPDFAQLKATFSDNIIMLTTIEKCEAMSDGKSIGNTSKLHANITTYLNKIKTDKKKKNKEIRRKKKAITKLKQNITKYANDKYSYKTGTTADAEFQTLINTDKKEIKLLNTELSKLNTEQTIKDTLMKDLTSLDNYISAQEQSSQGILSTNFADILSSLGSTNPNMAIINSLSDTIYAELIKSSQTNIANNEYSKIFKDYLSLQASLKIIEEIREIQSSYYDTDVSTIIKCTEKLVSSRPSKKDKKTWQTFWNNTFTTIKSNYYSLSSSFETSDNISKELIKKCKLIEKLQRNLLTELNGIERAKYYLFSTHSLLAWLSFLLALFLDSIPILLMIIKEHVNISFSQIIKQKQLRKKVPSKVS